MLPLQCPPFAPWKLGHGDLTGTITTRELRLTIATDLSGVPPLCHSCSLASLLHTAPSFQANIPPEIDQDCTFAKPVLDFSFHGTHRRSEFELGSTTPNTNISQLP